MENTESKDAYYRKIEKEFLEDYVEFGCKARLLALEIIKEACEKGSDDLPKQYLLYPLAFEQFMLQVETFEAFYRAARERKKRPVLATLEKDFNPGQLVQELKKKSEDELVAELVEGLDLGERDKKASDDLARGIVRIFCNKEFMTTLKFTIPVFNAVKHKFLVYRNEDGEPGFVIEPMKEKQLLDKANIAEADNEAAPPCEAIDMFYRMTQGLENAIKNLAALLLLHKNANN